MTTVRVGGTITLTAQWYAYAGGPAAPVTSVEIRIAPTGGGAAVVGPTSTGVVAEAVGLYSYAWAVADGTTVGDYVVLWTAVDSDLEAVQASELLTVADALVAGAYASVADLTDWLGSTPAGAERLLVRASRDVDSALLCSVYDADDADVQLALQQATCEQVAGMLDAGDLSGTGVAPASTGFTIGKVSVQQGAPGSGSAGGTARVGRLWYQAWLILQTAGLTGQGPQTW
ncbi:hypothetical protein MCAG_03833 [Micromonospora sp. ATCC 39149]|uniref:hypothetical protein n=1 Tax=Micromonospora sp. (strain ATCC 39149 / NRRL 15099 / SCC 1413) TaxID=219305 RepID=UPI0001A504D4|nr:hypothetical protein [Micromonospora sp. ATCC 39149]EEP73506.1 hypothetical protein MCAG_03833 [Micromonospora sp. ATCC 39149]